MAPRPGPPNRRASGTALPRARWWPGPPRPGNWTPRGPAGRRSDPRAPARRRRLLWLASRASLICSSGRVLADVLRRGPVQGLRPFVHSLPQRCTRAGSSRTPGIGPVPPAESQPRTDRAGQWVSPRRGVRLPVTCVPASVVCESVSAQPTRERRPDLRLTGLSVAVGGVRVWPSRPGGLGRCRLPLVVSEGALDLPGLRLTRAGCSHQVCTAGSQISSATSRKSCSGRTSPVPTHTTSFSQR